MGTLTGALRSLKGWQIGILAAVLGLVAVGTYGATEVLTSTDQSEISENQQLVSVQRGDLVNEIATDGSLVFPDTESLAFTVQGIVGKVVVESGQRVEVGDAIAVLDDATITSLEEAIATARVDLENAEEALVLARQPESALDLAQAQAKVAEAEVSVFDAEAALENLYPTEQDYAKAELNVSNATLALTSAQEALAGLLTPDADDIEDAQAAVDRAAISVETAQQAYDELIAGPDDRTVEDAKSDVERARIAVENARIAHDELVAGPDDKTVRDAEAAVERARISVVTAQAAYDTIIADPDPDDIEAATSAIDEATVALSNSLVDLEIVVKDWTDKIEANQAAVDSASDDYQHVYEAWLGIEITDAQAETGPTTLLKSLGVDLNVAYSEDAASVIVPVYGAIPSDDPSTPWDEMTVYPWVTFHPAPVEAVCGDSVVTRDTVCVYEEFEQAWMVYSDAVDTLQTQQLLSDQAIAKSQSSVANAENALEKARESLAKLMEPADQLDIDSKLQQVKDAESTLTKAEDDLGELLAWADSLDIENKLQQLTAANLDLEKAEADLAELIAGPDSLEIDSKRQQLTDAQVTLERAEESLAELMTDPDPSEIKVEQDQVVVAQAGLDQAISELEELRALPNPLDVAATEQRIDVAKAQLSEAEDGLADVMNSFNPTEFALREAQLASAQSGLDLALEQLEESTIRANMAGTVSDISVEAGDRILAGTPIAQLIDPTIVEIEGSVDEIDILFIQVGAAASVTMDALGGEVLDGVISSIDSQAQNEQGVVSYGVRVQLELPEGLVLLEGLTANATIVTHEESDVLLVPSQAISGTFVQPTIRVVDSSGTVDERPVSLGSNDDFWTVVTSGLAEGEQIVMDIQESSTQQFGGFAGGIPTGLTGGGGVRGVGGGGGRPQ